mmetsp:Transcript_25259/g.58909  ORF Transcript_25259/g.58909 Transcript_25259/m.58909 type:complete len:279 (+) Transcript_25259:809-1645(+)
MRHMQLRCQLRLTLLELAARRLQMRLELTLHLPELVVRRLELRRQLSLVLPQLHLEPHRLRSNLHFLILRHIPLGLEQGLDLIARCLQLRLTLPELSCVCGFGRCKGGRHGRGRALLHRVQHRRRLVRGLQHLARCRLLRRAYPLEGPDTLLSCSGNCSDSRVSLLVSLVQLRRQLVLKLHQPLLVQGVRCSKICAGRFVCALLCRTQPRRRLVRCLRIRRHLRLHLTRMLWWLWRRRLWRRCEHSRALGDSGGCGGVSVSPLQPCCELLLPTCEVES